MRIWEKNFEDINFFLYTKMFGNFHVWILCCPPSDRNIQHAAVNQETKIYQKQSVVRLSGAMSHDKPLSSLPTFGPRDTCWPLAGPHLCHGSFALWSPATSHTRAPYTVLQLSRASTWFKLPGHRPCWLCRSARWACPPRCLCCRCAPVPCRWPRGSWSDGHWTPGCQAQTNDCIRK